MNDFDSTFNPDVFLDEPNTGGLATAMEPAPAGEYTATIKEVRPPRSITRKNPGDPPLVGVDIVFELDAPDVAKSLGRTTLSSRYRLLIELDPATNKVSREKGKNVKLGRLLEAAGLNADGRAWRFSELVGKGPFSVVVKHVPDRNDPSIVYDEIDRVAPL